MKKSERHIENGLLTKLQRLEYFINSISDAIIFLDLNGIVIDVNRAFEDLYGWRKQEIIGKRLFIVPNELKDEFETIFEKVKNGQSISGYETTRITKTGEYIFVSITASPIRDYNGNIIGVVGITRDVTEKIKLRRELLAKIKELEKFYKLSVDRELKMIELKKQINEAFIQMNKRPPYDLSWVEK